MCAYTLEKERARTPSETLRRCRRRWRALSHTVPDPNNSNYYIYMCLSMYARYYKQVWNYLMSFGLNRVRFVRDVERARHNTLTKSGRVLCPSRANLALDLMDGHMAHRALPRALSVSLAHSQSVLGVTVNIELKSQPCLSHNRCVRRRERHTETS